MDSQDEKALLELGEILERFGKAMIAVGRKLQKTYQGGQMSFEGGRRSTTSRDFDEFGYRVCPNCSTRLFGEQVCKRCS